MGLNPLSAGRSFQTEKGLSNVANAIRLNPLSAGRSFQTNELMAPKKVGAS